jgi:hypothetical protein
MSWHYSRVLEAAFLAESSSGGDVSAQSNLIPPPGGCLPPDKTTDAARHSPYGTTCEPLTESRGVEWWILSLADSPAKIYPQTEKGPDLPEREVGCGLKCRASLARFDRASFSWKTHQFLLAGDLEKFSGTWPRWGIMHAGECWELVTPELVTKGNESGYWPTPQAHDCHKGAAKRVKRFGTKHGGRNLNDEVVKKEGLDGGWLNPQWVEWLMGWPMGWTDCGQSATDKFRQWCASHGIL